eukprot:6116508-Alexandrium_andersonii.AAC.1
MSASLVGSEMCIRDSLLHSCRLTGPTGSTHLSVTRPRTAGGWFLKRMLPCLLYTSDAADDM